MDIEIAERGRMDQSGSSLLRLIQNNDLPTLDLFVRESIQNSLDAADKDSPRDYVSVEFLCGEFESKKLCEKLDGITDALYSKYSNKEYSYVAVRDSETVGLTGPMEAEEIEENQSHGNLQKLIYEISNPQDMEGAGGSWGLGKTVYFRVGMGLVIYYSRIKIGHNKYESRMAATLVEDERGKNPMIPKRGKKPRRGIAWWGERKTPNHTVPITKEREINSILNIFDIPQYTDQETGTTIIIPYIDLDGLMDQNQEQYINSNGKPMIPYWSNYLDEYLKIAVQRWYAPRLNNPEYIYGKYLKANVNGKKLTRASIEPVFNAIRELYSASFESEGIERGEEFSEEISVENINIRNALADNSTAGVISFAKIKRDSLRMGPPSNKYSPEIYLNLRQNDGTQNRPIICFARKPGMIVSYEDDGKWVGNILPTEPDSYIIGVFRLNTENRISSNPPISLEEYVRKSEMADHRSWNDHGEIKGYSEKPIDKIQGWISKKISEKFNENDQTGSVGVESGMGRYFAQILLPQQGFGKASTVRPSKNSPSEEKHLKVKDKRLSIDISKISYTEDGMSVPVILELNENVSNTGFHLEIQVESGTVSCGDWESRLGMKMPFEIVSIIDVNGVLSGDGKESLLLDDDNSVKNTDIATIKFRTTASGKNYGVGIEMKRGNVSKIELIMNMIVYTKNVRPQFVSD